MSKSTHNNGKPWTPAEVNQLRKEAAGNVPTRVMGVFHGRSEAAIRSKAHEQDISLKPVNQSPYNRRPT